MIKTPRLLLRVFRQADAGGFHDVVAASREHLGEVYQRVFGTGDDSRTAAAKRIAQLRQGHLAGEHSSFAIFLLHQSLGESDMVGSIGLIPRIGAGANEIGYWISKSHVQKGYASEAAAAMTRIGFEIQNLHRMEIHTDPTNLASVGVARKIGFREQVLFRNGTLTADGPIRDSVMWSMTRAQYAGSSAASLAMEAFDLRERRLL